VAIDLLASPAELLKFARWITAAPGARATGTQNPAVLDK